MFDFATFAQGLALGLGMFVCPGPKDILILRQAFCQRSTVELIAIGVFSDALLIGLGMAGMSAALNRAPSLQAAALWLGVSLMAAHGLLAAWRAMAGTTAAPGEPPVTVGTGSTGSREGLCALLLVSLFNPAAWLDTVLVIGTAGAALPRAGQASFACGAVAASATWFLALVLGARRTGRWMTAPHMWRALDGFVAATMLGMAAYMAAGAANPP